MTIMKKDRAAAHGPGRALGMAVLCLAAAGLLLFSGAGSSADNRDSGRVTVKAWIDGECLSHPGKFSIPGGKTGAGFKAGQLKPGSSCHGGGVPENKGFSIRDGKNQLIYMWSQYRDQPPYEKGGPLEGLSPGEGEYALSVAGGAGAEIEISFELR